MAVRLTGLSLVVFVELCRQRDLPAEQLQRFVSQTGPATKVITVVHDAFFDLFQQAERIRHGYRCARLV